VGRKILTSNQYGAFAPGRHCGTFWRTPFQSHGSAPSDRNSEVSAAGGWVFIAVDGTSDEQNQNPSILVSLTSIPINLSFATIVHWACAVVRERSRGVNKRVSERRQLEPSVCELDERPRRVESLRERHSASRRARSCYEHLHTHRRSSRSRYLCAFLA